MRRPSGHPLSRLTAIVSLVWPAVPVLVWGVGDLVGYGAAIRFFGGAPLWWLAGLAGAVGLGLSRRYPGPAAPAWVRWAPWVGAALNGVGLLFWAWLMLRGLFH